MKKDGTCYLVFVHRENPKYSKWEIVHWGRPVALLAASLRKQWCCQLNAPLKFTKFEHATPLDEITARITKEAFASKLT